MVKNLGNAGQTHVGRIHNVLGEGSHHLIVYRTGDTIEQRGAPVDGRERRAVIAAPMV